MCIMRKTILIVLVTAIAVLGFFGADAVPLPSPLADPLANPLAEPVTDPFTHSELLDFVVVAILGFLRLSAEPTANSMANPHASSKVEHAALSPGERALRRFLGILSKL